MLVENENTGNAEVPETSTPEPETVAEPDTPEEDVVEEDGEEVEPEGTEPEETPTEQDFENIDPAKLPPETLKFYKGMQGSFTKKMQALSESLKALDGHKDRLGLLDKAIAGDKEAQDALLRIAGGKREEAPKPSEEDLYKDIPADFDSTVGLVKYLDQRFNGILQGVLQQYIPEVLKRELEPVVGPLNDLRQKASKETVHAEATRLKNKYPDFDSHIDKMVALKKEKPHLTMEEAYKLASYKDPVKPEKIVSKPGKRPGASIKPEPKGNLSFEQAAELALKQLHKKG